MKIHRLTMVAAVAAAFTLHPAAGEDVWTAGHGDLGIGYNDILAELEPHVHLHSGAVVNGSPISSDAEYEPGDVIPQIPFNKSLSRPAGSQWNFFGVNPGDPLWIFPQTQDPTLPYIGLGAEELEVADWSGPFILTLTNLAGSGAMAGGHFSLYTTDGFGSPTVFMKTSDGISSADSTTLNAGGHAHYNFAFTKPGMYEVTFSITGNHVVEGVLSASATYKFQVVPEPTTFALLGLGAAAFLLRRRKMQTA